MSEFHQGGELRRELGPLDAVMLNVGSVIGSGIFFVPAAIAASMDSPPAVLFLWLVGGVASLFGALAVAELGAASPRAGGLYVYLHEAYGPLVGFLYGWTSFWVINTASVAAIAVAFGNYLGATVGWEGGPRTAISIGVILLLSGINYLGVRWGALVQTSMGILKVTALVGMTIAIFALPGGDSSHLVGDGFSLGDVSAAGVAMVGVLWSFDGWIQVSYAAGEIKNPRRVIPMALLVSMVTIVTVYLLANGAYLHALSLEGVRASERVASDALAVVLGDLGANLMVAAVLISTFGAGNGFLLGAARIYYAMAKERLFFATFAQVHPRFGTPSRSLALQCVWGCILAASGTFEQLFSYVIFASWLFYALTVMAVFVMRRKRSLPEDAYRTPGYPVTPLVFIAFALALVGNAFATALVDSLIGLGIILAGVPAYLWFARRQRAGA